MAKLTPGRRAALEAVRDGFVHHAHPFSWGTDIRALNVKPSTLQHLAKIGLIRVHANADGYWRPVSLTDAGQAALVREAEEKT